MKMHKVMLACCFLFLSASMAMAQGKVDVQWNCAQPAPSHSMDTGEPNHSYSISQVKCTAARGEIAGVKSMEGVGTEFHELTGASDRFHGVFVETLANGEKITYSYEGTATIKDGKLQAADNKWSAKSGTGTFKGIKAVGTCKGVAKPDGTTTFECSGEYSTAK